MAQSVRVGPSWLTAAPAADDPVASAQAEAAAIRAAAEAEREQIRQAAREEGWHAGWQAGQAAAAQQAAQALATLQAQWTAVTQALQQLSDWLTWVQTDHVQALVAVLAREFVRTVWADHPNEWAAYVQRVLAAIPADVVTVIATPALDAALRQAGNTLDTAGKTVTWQWTAADAPWDTLLAQWADGGVVATVHDVLAATIQSRWDALREAAHA